MEIFSILGGIDSLRKLAVILGLLLMGLGFLYPIQKSLELNEKKIKLKEAQKLTDIELSNIKQAIDNMEYLVHHNSKKLSSLSNVKDSLMTLKFNDNIRFKIGLIEGEINSINENENILMNDKKNQLLNVEKYVIKKETLTEEVNNLEYYLKMYNTYKYLSIILGFIVFLSGAAKWKKSQKESDEIKKLQLDIQKEELKKLQKENQ